MSRPRSLRIGHLRQDDEPVPDRTVGAHLRRAAGLEEIYVQRWLGGLPRFDEGHLATVAKVRSLLDDAPSAPTPDSDIDAVRWDPASGETVADRLRDIVAESMGYDAEDLPDELPLIEEWFEFVGEKLPTGIPGMLCIP